MWLIQISFLASFASSSAQLQILKIPGLCVGFNSGDYFWGLFLGAISGEQFLGYIPTGVGVVFSVHIRPENATRPCRDKNGAYSLHFHADGLQFDAFQFVHR